MNRGIFSLLATLIVTSQANATLYYTREEKPEPPVSKIVSELFSGREFDAIEIKGETKFKEVEIRTSRNSDVGIAFEALAPHSKPDRLNTMLSAIEVVIDRRTLKIRSNLGMYMCLHYKETRNGHVTVETVTGACYGKLVIALPANSTVAVSLDGKPLNAQATKSLSSSQFTEALKAITFDDKKMFFIDETLAQNRGLAFTAREAAVVVKAMTFKDAKKSVAMKIAPRIPRHDREDFLDLIEDELWMSDRQEVGRYVRRLP